jgi:uncharacterized membrane protein
MWGYGGQDAIPTMSLHAWTWMLLAGLALIGFSLVLVSGVLLLSGWLAHRSLQVPARMGRRPAVPLVVLQRRYAAGEIDQATYDRMKRDLAA